MSDQRERLQLLQQVLDAVPSQDIDGALAVVARWVITQAPNAGTKMGKILNQTINDLLAENAALRARLAVEGHDAT